MDWSKDSSQYRTLDTIDGESMELEWKISQDPLHCSSSKKSKSSCTKWATQVNSKDELSSCRCSMTSHCEWKTMNRNVLLITCVCVCKKMSSRALVIPRTWVRNKVVFHYQRKNQDENGIESLNWWWSNLAKANIQSSEPRVHWPEERSKAKEVENYRYTSVPKEIRLKLFFAQLFLVISSVSTEQSQMCVKNTVLVKQERRDPYWQDNLTLCSSQQHYW